MKLKTYFGKSIEGAYEKYLEESEKNSNAGSNTIDERRVPTNIENAAQYLILPGNKHGNYEYPDLLVSAVKSLKGKNWNQAWDSLKQEDSFMLTIRQYLDFLKLLKSGKAYDGKGKIIDKAKLDEILDEILTVRNPWRAEWLDAKFNSQGMIRKQFYITYHKFDNGKLVEVTEELDRDTLFDDRKIDLDYLINTDATHQGLPPQNIPEGKFSYWHPRDGAVARFDADSGRADLSCNRIPQGSDASLGVRSARRAAP